MEMGNTFWGLWLFIIVFILCILAIIWTMLEVFKQGDERRQKIIHEASTETFIIGIVILFFESMYMIYQNNVGFNNYHSNPLIELAVICIIFLIDLRLKIRKFS
ncbi:hypothetical protein ACQV2X_03375 [Facklamia sp. P12945]|uniref:hypothetical protein n=1 Tax=unclassified Facklamia TaxID=2622293 RepID=UPI003D17755A